MNDTIRWDSSVAGEITDLLLKSVRGIEDCVERIVGVHAKLSRDNVGEACAVLVEKLHQLKSELENLEQDTTDLRRGVVKCVDLFEDAENEISKLNAGVMADTDSSSNTIISISMNPASAIESQLPDGLIL